MIKAIETEYKGYKFRSRLEARWAVFFDKMGYKWQYELEGYRTNYDKNSIFYLPDFYLPDFHTWVEVKGSDEALMASMPKIEGILDWDSPLPYVKDSFKVDGRDFAPGLLLLGEIPYSQRLSQETFFFHPLLQHYKGIIPTEACFLKEGILVSKDIDNYQYLDERKLTLEAKLLSFPTWRFEQHTDKAYKAAKQARFEHGYRNE